MAAKKHLQTTEWHGRALKLHIDGWGFAAIGRHLGKSTSVVRRAIHEELEAITEDYADVLKQRREVTSAQLDAIIKGHMKAAKTGGVNAASVVLAALDKRIRLHGLAAAEKIDINAALTLSFDAHEALLTKLSKLVAPTEEEHDAGGDADEDRAPASGGTDEVRSEPERD